MESCYLCEGRYLLFQLQIRYLQRKGAILQVLCAGPVVIAGDRRGARESINPKVTTEAEACVRSATTRDLTDQNCRKSRVERRGKERRRAPR